MKRSAAICGGKGGQNGKSREYSEMFTTIVIDRKVVEIYVEGKKDKTERARKIV